MRIWYVLVAVLLLVVGVVVGFFIREASLTGEVVKGFDEYSYTRAICSERECIDVLVLCYGGNVIGIEPISYFVEFEDGWEDPRGEDVSRFCK